MPIYVYAAMDKQGKKVKGKVEATNQGRVLTDLKEKGLYPVEVVEQGALQKDINIYIGNPVKTKDLTIFCRQFATILSAGVSVLAAIDILKQQTENQELSKILHRVYDDVEKGTSLGKSMKEFPKIFPNILVNMIEAGEYSGSLELSFDRMAIHFEKEYKLKQSVQKALMYPMIISVVALIVVGVLVVVVVPNFVGMFSGIGMELPASTKMLLSISDFVKTKWYLIIGFIFIIIVGLSYFLKSEAGKLLFAGLKLKIPIIGNVNTKVVASRFTRTLSTLVATGLPLITALEIVAKVVDNWVVEKGLLEAADQVSRGVPLSAPIEEMDVFPPMVVHMVKIGEDTGTLESTLNKVADFYDMEVETAVTQMTTMIEPIIIVVMAVVVGFIVMSVIQPMFQMYEGLGNL